MAAITASSVTPNVCSSGGQQRRAPAAAFGSSSLHALRHQLARITAAVQHGGRAHELRLAVPLAQHPEAEGVDGESGNRVCAGGALLAAVVLPRPF